MSDELTPAEETVKNYRPIAELIPAHWSQGKVSANGIRIHYYRTGGDKPPLLLLHGFLEGALSWLRTARVLEQAYDVIMPDTRGHGNSDGIESGFSSQLLVEDAAGVMRALALPASRVLGFSQGGLTGIHLAATYPDLVRRLIVSGWGDETPGTNVAGSPGYQAWFNTYLSWLQQLKTQTHQERMVSALSQQQPGAPLLWEEEYVPWVENCARLDLKLVKQSMSMWSEVGVATVKARNALRRVSCPVLILKSSFFPTPGAPRYTREEESELAHVKIIRFVNSGHLIHREQFEPFMTAVKTFLA